MATFFIFTKYLIPAIFYREQHLIQTLYIEGRDRKMENSLKTNKDMGLHKKGLDMLSGLFFMLNPTLRISII